MTPKKDNTSVLSPLFLFLFLDPIRDPGGKNQDPG